MTERVYVVVATLGGQPIDLAWNSAFSWQMICLYRDLHRRENPGCATTIYEYEAQVPDALEGDDPAIAEEINDALASGELERLLASGTVAEHVAEGEQPGDPDAPSPPTLETPMPHDAAYAEAEHYRTTEEAAERFRDAHAHAVRFLIACVKVEQFSAYQKDEINALARYAGIEERL